MFQCFVSITWAGAIVIIIAGLIWRQFRTLPTLAALDIGVSLFLLGQALLFVFFKTGIGPYGKYTQGVGAQVWLGFIVIGMGVLIYYLNRSYFKHRPS